MGETAPKFGRIAYEAYRDSTGGKSLVSGAPIPYWSKLPALIQNAWGAAANAVRSRILLDGMEK